MYELLPNFYFSSLIIVWHGLFFSPALEQNISENCKYKFEKLPARSLQILSKNMQSSAFYKLAKFMSIKATRSTRLEDF